MMKEFKKNNLPLQNLIFFSFLSRMLIYSFILELFVNRQKVYQLLVDLDTVSAHRSKWYWGDAQLKDFI